MRLHGHSECDITLERQEAEGMRTEFTEIGRTVCFRSGINLGTLHIAFPSRFGLVADTWMLQISGPNIRRV